MARDPYCSNCGYLLVGLTDSSKCPECGRPLVEVLMRDQPAFRAGKRYKSDIVLFGLPLIHIAIGPHEDEPYGQARGVIAIGDVARGWFALGGMAFGIVAVGGLAVGVFALGGLAVGLLALGGGAIGAAAVGGGAAGGIANGGGAVGVIAHGGGAIGYYARGGGALGVYVLEHWPRKDPEAVRFFSESAWLLGAGSPLDFTFPVWVGIAGAAVVFISAFAVLLRYLASERRYAS